MKNKALYLIPALLLGAALTPAQAGVDAFAYAHQIDAVHVNVFRPIGGQPAAAGEVEASMMFGKIQVLVGPEDAEFPGEGGCVDLYRDGVIDYGCGPLSVEPDGVMGVTRVHGTIDSSAYSYTPENGFEDLGSSTITIDLTVTGTGLIERSPYTNYAAGVCGLPPETRGAFVDARPELQRESAMTGTLTSAVIGDVDPTAFPSLLVSAPMAVVGACVNDDLPPTASLRNLGME